MPKTICMNQADLNAYAKSVAHPFQKTVLEYMLARGWNVKSAIPNRVGWKQVVVISLTHKDSGFCGIAPNGLVFRPAKGKTKIEWNWKRMADLADATIPAINAAFGNLPQKVA